MLCPTEHLIQPFSLPSEVCLHQLAFYENAGNNKNTLESGNARLMNI